MVAGKTTTRRRKKKPARKQWLFPGLGRLLLFLLLFLLLIFSLCTAGYVIFFRTVSAEEIMVVPKNSIVYEEPDSSAAQKKTGRVAAKTQAATVHEMQMGEAEDNLPKVAVIINDIGYHYGMGKQLLGMPLKLTFSFLPFAPYTRQLEEAAYKMGKTIFLHLPLQPRCSQFDPGPGAVLLEDSPAVQRAKLQRCLGEVPHAVGVNNHMGSLYTEDKKAMALMSELSRRSLVCRQLYDAVKRWLGECKGAWN